ncbi:hypothetical protein [Planotetraspora kaengkrachanensis]|uniref:Uncharacterized protein n=1 Tax=Planotetraspora kaengkrachanensis TaxID=575193 RepID=A0A8J3Q0A2_9ACTN|nr:hypothetical protein [Planotetraspora kaengkrachanensis]GIG84230.1 hypothetical protein Pka01_73570 [Planotetraspora kaengkrachanensis]
MSEGYPTAAQKEALRLICRHGQLDTEHLGERLVAARRSSTNPGFTAAMHRMAGSLAWRLRAQGFIAEAEHGSGSTTTQDGRKLIACTGERG